MPSFTLAQLEQRIWDTVDDNVGEYPEPQVRGVINEGLRRINNLTGIFQGSVLVPGSTVAGQLIYQFPAGILFPLRVYYEGRELSKFTLQRLAETRQSWAVETTSNIGPVVRWAPIDLRTFVINPIDSSGGGLLEVDGVLPIVPLVNQGDVIQLDDQYVEILILYGKHRLPVKEGGRAFTSASKSYPVMVSKLKSMLMFEGYKFPRYYIEKDANQSEEKGA